MKVRVFEPVEAESNEKFEGMPESFVRESGKDRASLDSMGEKSRSSQEYFPNEEARINRPEVKSVVGPVEEKVMGAVADEGGEATAQQNSR